MLVGNVAASEIYVRSKVQSLRRTGHLQRPDYAARDRHHRRDAGRWWPALNARDEIDGILIQLPLPAQVDTKALLDAIAPGEGRGRLSPGECGPFAGWPSGSGALHAGRDHRDSQAQRHSHRGQHAVVVGRSDIVGKPAAMLLLHQNATVTICHSKTRDLGAITRQADILVAAIGRAGLHYAGDGQTGATMIDVGINRITDRAEFDRFFAGDAKREAAFAKRGSVVVGDVDPKAFEVAGAYTPVPGGVGPLTIAMLMANTVRAAKMRRGL